MSRRDKLRLRDIVASIETIRAHLDEGPFDGLGAAARQLLDA